jgi:hypothetical protein
MAQLQDVPQVLLDRFWENAIAVNERWEQFTTTSDLSFSVTCSLSINFDMFSFSIKIDSNEINKSNDWMSIICLMFWIIERILVFQTLQQLNRNTECRFATTRKEFRKKFRQNGKMSSGRNGHENKNIRN